MRWPHHYQIELAQSEDSTGYNLHGSSEIKFAANKVNRPTHATRSQLEFVMVILSRDLKLAVRQKFEQVRIRNEQGEPTYSCDQKT